MLRLKVRYPICLSMFFSVYLTPESNLPTLSQ